MTNRRMLAVIRSSLERSIQGNRMHEAAQGLTALVLVQKDVIAELERENARLRLDKKYQRKAA